MCNKKEKERKKGEEGEKKGRKTIKILEVTKPILIILFLMKEFRMEQWPYTGRVGVEAHIQCRQYWGALPMNNFITRIKSSKSWFCFYLSPNSDILN